MGSDKAFLKLKGKTFLERALDIARAVTPEVMIIGESSKFLSYAPVVEDIFQQRGPLGGIHSGLTHTTTELNLFVAVDLPFLDPAFLNFLCARARANDALVTIARAAGGLQPLCAVYRKGFLEPAEKALIAGQNKIDSLFTEMSVAQIEQLEITEAGFPLDIFRNINTREELAAEGGSLTQP